MEEGKRKTHQEQLVLEKKSDGLTKSTLHTRDHILGPNGKYCADIHPKTW